jgi:four helix bundle protein
MKFYQFEEILAWQKAQDLAVLIYKEFSNVIDFGYKNQIQNAVVSISNNIAEGFDRMSDREFVRFLYISLGSCSEVKSMLYFGNRLSYLDESSSKMLIERANEVARIIRGLIKSLSPKG